MKGLTTMTTVLCTNCGINEAPAPESVEVDPLCPACANNLPIFAQVGAPKEPKPCADCSKYKTKLTTEGLCADCEELAMEENRYCPGWNDSCSQLLPKGNDLCPDCTMGRMNAQSPRIPQ